MIQAKCIEKFRDKNNKIIGYRLIDLNKKTQDFTPEVLKHAIENKKIHVVNLTLTSDGRLMNTSDKVLPYQEKVSPTAKVKKLETVKKNALSDRNINVSDLAKAFTIIDWAMVDMGDSFEEYVEAACEFANIKCNVWDLEGKEEQIKLSNIAYQKILDNSPDVLINDVLIRKMYEIIDDEYACQRIKDDMYHENVNKLNQSKMYKAVYLIFKHFKEKDKRLAKRIKENLIDDMKQNGVASTKVGYEVGHDYFSYLDEDIFGTITNCYGTVGHILTSEEKKEFKELKPYSYIFRKEFNGLGDRPEVGITYLFKNGESGKVIVDVKMSRTGYVSEHCVMTVGYIKDLDSFTLDVNNKDNAKIVGNHCNKMALKIKEFALKNRSLLRILPMGAKIENFN